jgi:outer membrane protein assembly factor BamA
VRIAWLSLGIAAAASTPAAAWAPPYFAPPFVVARWSVEGDVSVDAAELARLLPWAPRDSVPPSGPERAAELLRERLVDAGWWSARVSAETRDETPAGREVALVASAGERVRVGDVAVRGNVLLTREEILSRMELRPGQPFDRATFDADAARILRLYSERAHPLARVYPSRFRFDGERLSFVVRLGEGPAASLESVRVFGNRTTNDRVVARIAGLRPGDPWDVRKIERMAGRLRREGLFTSVGEPRVVRGSRDNLLGVEIEVEEGPSSSVFGVLGYNPGREGKGDVVGLVQLDLRNLLGTARRASLHFEKQPGDVRDLSFRYREPWVLGSPLSLEVGAAQALRDTLYSRTDLDAAVAIPTGDRSTFRIAAERRSSSFDDSAGRDVSETATGGSVGWSIDARDRRINPTRGWLSGLTVGARKTESGARRTRIETTGQVLAPWGRAWVVSQEGGFRGVWSSEDDVPLYEQYYLGGTRTLRGYREEQFHGQRVWWTRSELRYRLTARSRAYVFGDVGGFEFEERLSGAPPRDVSDVLAGGGVGASVESRGSGVVRFELALGRGDGFSDAKVHVGLEQEF